MKKFIILISLTILICFMFVISPAASNDSFPKRDLMGVIMWGAGGETDNVARTITPLVEKYLGKSIILQNKSGAAGALSTRYVKLLPADGYNLLYGAENPQLHKILDLSDIDYNDFYCVNILARGIGMIVVPKDSPYKTLEQLIEDAKARPGQLDNAVTGIGGLPFTVSAMVESVNGVTFNPIPFGGSGPALTALLGGHTDLSMVAFGSASEFIRAGKIRALAVINNERIEGFEDIPAITEIYPEYSKFLPWGPFYGIWVRKDIPEEAKAKLVEAFGKAFKEERFQTFLKNIGSLPMGISGEEADEFLRSWQSTSAWILYDVGAAKFSPEKFSIPKP